MVKTKRIYDKPEKKDGTRILVMRFWPRGVSKMQVDEWFKELGTEKELLQLWKSGKISWCTFKKNYCAFIRKKEIHSLVLDLAHRSKNETLTLLCACEDEFRCHRSLLKAEINKYL